MSFKTHQAVWATIQSMVDAEGPRALNRTRINKVFNGEAPYTDQEATENNIDTNVNFLEGNSLIHRARDQYVNAFFTTRNFFEVSLDFGPLHKRMEWGNIITRRMNRPMKRSKSYFHTLQNQFAGTVLHGIGPVYWFRGEGWCPKPLGIDELYVPSKTTVDLANLEHFAIRGSLNACQLYKATSSERADSGWNKPMVKKCLKWLAEQVTDHRKSEPSSTAADYPEDVEEDFKENSGYWASDAVPTIKIFEFYYKDYETETDEGSNWRRKIVLDKNAGQLEGETNKDSFLYDGKSKSHGRSEEEILHIQFADGAVKAPFRYHSVRSLGWLLYGACHLQNRIRCKFSDAISSSLMWYFYNVATGDEERLMKIDLVHMGILPEGVKWVPPNERPMIDAQLMEMAFKMYRGLMQEHSSAYIQHQDSSSNQEKTAFQVMTETNQANAIIGSMLTRSYTHHSYQGREIARRFCTLSHKQCKQFREDCQADGVPAEVFKRWEDWDVVPERVLGGGNKVLAIAQSDRLMSVRPAYSPEAQKKILHIFTLANTDNPDLANDLAPIEDEGPSKAAFIATLAWGTLIDAKPVALREDVDRVEYAEILLSLLGQDIERINAAGGTPDLPRIQGLSNVIEHVGEIIEFISQDDAQQQRVKIYKDVLGKASNEVKAYIQRFEEAMKAKAEEEQQDPVDIAKVQTMIAESQAKLEAQAQSHALAMEQKQIAFEAEQGRKNAAFVADQGRKQAQIGADLAEQGTRATADITEQRVRAAAEIASKTQKADIDIDTAERKADAEIEVAKKKASAAPKQPKKPSK